MSEFINTSKEIFYGDRYFKEHVMPPDFDYRAHKKELSPFWANHGFKVSMMYDDFYSRFNGVHSDRYVSMDLYYFYIIPSCNRRDLMNAYTDKNMYSVLFDGFRQPETIVKNINGHFYDCCGEELSLADAIDECFRVSESCIIKPTMETSNGDGVALFRNEDKVVIQSQLESYRVNFIVQKKLKQHSVMEGLNPSSLNTLRVYTYRRLDGKVVNGEVFLRVGGRGAVKDNISSGGGLLYVSKNGDVRDRMCRFKTMAVGSLKRDYGFSEFQIPSFPRVKEFAVRLHERMPYFDWIGFDVAIGIDGEPIFVEMNTSPFVEGPEMSYGPLFEFCLDEIVERIRFAKHQTTEHALTIFKPGYDKILQTGGEPYNLN